jgi:hypothetical protein
MGITHLFSSAKADGADATVVQPTDWNDDHVIALNAYATPSVIAGMWNNSNITAYSINPFTTAYTTTGSISLTDETTTVMPFSLPANVKVAKVHFEVVTGYGAVNMRVVIYDHDATNGRPNNLLDDSGDISVDVAATKTWDVSPDLALTGGELYWMGLHKAVTDATGAVRSLSHASEGVVGMSDGYTTSPNVSLQATGQTASAPADPFPTTHSLTQQGFFMIMEIVAP